MSGLTPLLDTLLATRLAQRLDLLPLKGQFDLVGTGPTPVVPQVGNDVRLASREALQQQLGVLGSDVSGAEARAAPGGAAASVSLSAAARALTNVLEAPAGVPSSRILGLAPLWMGGPAPETPQLAASLARTLSNSGLFYESHLQQFVQGERSLTQMAQEPQARLESSALPMVRAVPTGEANAAGLTSVATPVSVEPTSPAIHPSAVGLVRQQLELLTQPQFRWSGEAWPGAPLQWDVEEEQEPGPRAAEPEAAAHSWTTRLVLGLPALGTVEARLRITGSTLEVRLGARQPATLSLLGEAGSELPGRLSAQGLQLAALQIVPLAQDASIAS